jgi:ATP-independent RNA helicase DbpA
VTFENIIDDKNMLENLKKLGFTKPTAIQEKAIPPILERRDVLAKAKTGSGKTAAFGIPILLHLDIQKRYDINTLILAPTRELANQVASELRNLARFEKNIKILTLTGGTPLRAQANSLSHGAHIVVGTPGRVLDLLNKEVLKLDSIQTLVLDEADKMLDMGFADELNHILEKTPTSRQTLLFSATFEDAIKQLSHSVQKDRIEIEIEEQVNVTEIFLEAKEDKEEILKGVISKYTPKSCIIFTNTKAKSLELEAYLQELGLDAFCINSDLEQIDRDETLIKFANGSCNFLIATDVASRGLDIKKVELVINYDFPQSDQTYTHRIGRTGRNDQKGIAISFTNQKGDDISLHVKDKFFYYEASMGTLCIDGGKKQKLRAGDILGVLIKQAGLLNEQIGLINVTDFYSYVAIEKNALKKVLNKLKNCTIKTKRYRAWII